MSNKLKKSTKKSGEMSKIKINMNWSFSWYNYYLFGKLIHFCNLIKIRDKGEWDSLPQDQRTDREQNLQQLSGLAQFHNMLGTSTIEILIRISKEVRQLIA